MSRETEKVFRKLDAYLAQHEPADEEELNALVQQFMNAHNEAILLGQAEADPEDAYDYLEQAEDAKTKKDKLRYIAQALALEPGNLDALLMQASINAKDLDQYYDLLQPILMEGTRQMQAAGYFKESKGDFWLVHETRPYMRVREENFSVLIELGRMKKAIQEGEELLKLCTNDNLGIRYRLMHLYAYTEDIKGASRLHKKYDNYDDTQMLLPRCVLYYKLEDLETARNFLSRLVNYNKDAKKFFAAAAKDRLDEYYEEMSPLGYRAASMGELLYCVGENDFLYDTVTEEYLTEDGSVSGLRLRNVKTGESFTKPFDGIFLAVGQKPQNDFLHGAAAVDPEGYLYSDETALTGTAGIFAAGDCRTKDVRQLTTAVGDGACAAIAACRYLDR